VPVRPGRFRHRSGVVRPSAVPTSIRRVGKAEYARIETRQNRQDLPWRTHSIDGDNYLVWGRIKTRSQTRFLSLWAEAVLFAKAYRYADYPRLLFITKDKRIGITTASAKAGNIVFLIYGTNAPFVLRKVKDKNEYTLIGEAYCHSLIGGEGMMMMMMMMIIIFVL
jgi:hypothetical protein